MKSREQIYRKEAATLLRDLTTYHFMYREQLLRLYPGKESKIENLLSYFLRQGRIFYEKNTDLYHDGTEAKPDMSMLAAIWVLTDFIEKVEYHSAVDFPAALIFVADGELYEVLHIPVDKEAVTEHAIAQQGCDAEKRIVIVEDPKQVERLYIPNVTAYCTVDMQTGAIQYYRQEESHG
jgi:hypothetical protein